MCNTPIEAKKICTRLEMLFLSNALAKSFQDDVVLKGCVPLDRDPTPLPCGLTYVAKNKIIASVGPLSTEVEGSVLVLTFDTADNAEIYRQNLTEILYSTAELPIGLDEDSFDPDWLTAPRTPFGLVDSGLFAKGEQGIRYVYADRVKAKALEEQKQHLIGSFTERSWIRDMLSILMESSALRDRGADTIVATCARHVYLKCAQELPFAGWHEDSDTISAKFEEKGLELLVQINSPSAIDFQRARQITKEDFSGSSKEAMVNETAYYGMKALVGTGALSTSDEELTSVIDALVRRSKELGAYEFYASDVIEKLYRKETPLIRILVELVACDLLFCLSFSFELERRQLLINHSRSLENMKSLDGTFWGSLILHAFPNTILERWAA